MDTYSDVEVTGSDQVYDHVKFTRCKVLLDSNKFVACEFQDCQLIYCGHPDGLPFDRCAIGNVRFVLDGPAHHTVQFLIGVGKIRDGGEELLTQFMACLRAGVTPTNDTVRPIGVSLQ